MKTISKFKLLVCALTVFLTYNATAQYDTIEELLAEANTLKSEYKFAKAERVYQMAIEDWDDCDAHFGLAEIYKLQNKLAESAFEYEKGLQTSRNVDPKQFYKYADVLVALERFDEAHMWYNAYLSFMEQDQRAVAKLYTLEHRENLFAESNKYFIEKVQFGGGRTEFSPAVYNDEMLFVSTRNDNMQSGVFDGVVEYSDIYSTKIVGENQMTKPKLLEKEINSKWHEGPLALCREGSEMIFTRSDPSKRKEVVRLQLFEAKMKDGEWEEAKKLPFVSNNASYGHPALTEDGNTLIFVSDMEGGKGETDLYICKREGDGEWSTPESLHAFVNTTGKEMFPTIYKDEYLFFASDGHGGLGGLDNFVCKLDSLEMVSNLGFPINSGSDDFSLITLDDDKSGYFSSNRNSTNGDDDIFRFVRSDADPNYIAALEKKTEFDEELFGIIMTAKTTPEFARKGGKKNNWKQVMEAMKGKYDNMLNEESVAVWQAENVDLMNKYDEDVYENEEVLADYLGVTLPDPDAVNVAENAPELPETTSEDLAIAETETNTTTDTDPTGSGMPTDVAEATSEDLAIADAETKTSTATDPTGSGMRTDVAEAIAASEKAASETGATPEEATNTTAEGAEDVATTAPEETMGIAGSPNDAATASMDDSPLVSLPGEEAETTAETKSAEKTNDTNTVETNTAPAEDIAMADDPQKSENDNPPLMGVTTGVERSDLLELRKKIAKLNGDPFEDFGTSFAPEDPYYNADFDPANMSEDAAVAAAKTGGTTAVKAADKSGEATHNPATPTETRNTPEDAIATTENTIEYTPGEGVSEEVVALVAANAATSNTAEIDNTRVSVADAGVTAAAKEALAEFMSRQNIERLVHILTETGEEQYLFQAENDTFIGEYRTTQGGTQQLDIKTSSSASTALASAETPMAALAALIGEGKISENKSFNTLEVRSVHFDYDKSAIRKEDKKGMDDLAALLKSNGALKVVCTAHTDVRGSNAYNMALSERRSNSAADYLIAQGVDPMQIKMDYKGETVPAMCKSGKDCSEADHFTNRRADFHMVLSETDATASLPNATAHAGV